MQLLRKRGFGSKSDTLVGVSRAWKKGSQLQYCWDEVKKWLGCESQQHNRGVCAESNGQDTHGI